MVMGTKLNFQFSSYEITVLAILTDCKEHGIGSSFWIRILAMLLTTTSPVKFYSFPSFVPLLAEQSIPVVYMKSLMTLSS